MKNSLLLALLALLTSLYSFNIAAKFPCDGRTYAGPILQNGRIKPYIVHANEVIKF